MTHLLRPISAPPHVYPRFLEKRKRRVWTKGVQYEVRKNFADSRVRVHGRFLAKQNEIDEQDEDEEDAHLPNACLGQTRARTFHGISRAEGKWRARVRNDGKQIYAGIHATREQAARAYDAKAKELKGADARLNFPDDGSSAGAAAVKRGQLEGMARPRKAFDGAAAVGRDVSMFFTGYGTYSGVVSSRELVNGRWSYALCFHADSSGAYAARGDMERGDVVTVSEEKLQALLHDSSGGSSDGFTQGAVSARARLSHSALATPLAAAASAHSETPCAKRCAPTEAAPARPAQRHKREQAEAAAMTLTDMMLM